MFYSERSQGSPQAVRLRRLQNCNRRCMREQRVLEFYAELRGGKATFMD